MVSPLRGEPPWLLASERPTPSPAARQGDHWKLALKIERSKLRTGQEGHQPHLLQVLPSRKQPRGRQFSDCAQVSSPGSVLGQGSRRRAVVSPCPCLLSRCHATETRQVSSPGAAVAHATERGQFSSPSAAVAHATERRQVSSPDAALTHASERVWGSFLTWPRSPLQALPWRRPPRAGQFSDRAQVSSPGAASTQT